MLVEIAVQSWGVHWRRQSGGAVHLQGDLTPTLTNLDGSAVTIYSDNDYSSDTIAAVDFMTDSEGVLPGWIEVDTYLFTEPLDGTIRQVEASGAVRLEDINEGLLEVGNAPTWVAPDTVSESPDYLGFGFIRTFPSGLKIDVFRRGDSHPSTDPPDEARHVARFSTDGGETFPSSSEIDIWGVEADVEHRNPYGGITREGRAVVFSDRWEAGGAQALLSLGYRYCNPQDDPRDPDNWKTGTSVIPTTLSDGVTPMTQVAPFSNVTPIADGKHLMGFYGRTGVTGLEAGNTYSMFTLETSDGGVTWGNRVFIRESTDNERFNEFHLAWDGGRKVIAIARERAGGSGTELTFTHFRSTDNAGTWARLGTLTTAGVSFTQPTSPCLAVIQPPVGQKEVALYWYDRGTFDLWVIYGQASGVFGATGHTFWLPATKRVVATGAVADAGNPTVDHPNGNPRGLGRTYDNGTLDYFVNGLTAEFHGNVGFGNTTSANFGGGAGVIHIQNAKTAPSTDPTDGGILYSAGGTLFYRGPSGTVTPVALP